MQWHVDMLNGLGGLAGEAGVDSLFDVLVDARPDNKARDETVCS